MNKPTPRHLSDFLVASGVVLLAVMILFPRPFLVSGPAIYTGLLLCAAAMTAVVLGTRPVRLLAKPQPHFVIDAAGIHPLGFGLPPVTWDSIRRISIKYRLLNGARRYYLCIDYHDLDAAAKVHDIVRKRPRLSGHILIAPGRICIDFSPMRPTIDDACRAIEQICTARAQSAHPTPTLNLELPGKELQVIFSPSGA